MGWQGWVPKAATHDPSVSHNPGVSQAMLIVPSATRVDLAVPPAELPQPPSYSEVIQGIAWIRGGISIGMAPAMTVPILLPSLSPPWDNIPPQSPGSIPEHPSLCSGNGEEIPNPRGW